MPNKSGRMEIRMALSIFIDALPYTEVSAEYKKWFENEQCAELIPNIAYSSTLHWQLYCNKYPDDRLKFVDWQKVPETAKSIRIVSDLLRPFDKIKPLSFVFRKAFDRIIFKKNILANVPFKFRKDFSEQSEYLFWDKKIYSKEATFKNYIVVSQDEGHLSFEETIRKVNEMIDRNEKNIFLCIGEIDHQGHLCARGAEYTRRIHRYMDTIHEVIQKYISLYPHEEILIISDHGMSTINNRIDFKLEKQFGKQSKQTYIAYTDSCVMCVWVFDEKLYDKISQYLLAHQEGHLLTEKERCYYKATNRMFGDLIYILKEGNCFKTSWFGCSIRKNDSGEGMHGFWPEREAKDQMASIILINGHRKINDIYTYEQAYSLITSVMQGKRI